MAWWRRSPRRRDIRRALGARVPRLDGAVERQAEDRIGRRLDDGGERAHPVLGLLALGDVAERRHDEVAVVAKIGDAVTDADVALLLELLLRLGEDVVRSQHT